MNCCGMQGKVRMGKRGIRCYVILLLDNGRLNEAKHIFFLILSTCLTRDAAGYRPMARVPYR